MTKALKDAIMAVISSPTLKKNNQVETLKTAYESHIEGMTDTQKRVEFLQDCLETGMAKRDAAKALCEHDPRVGPGTAETLVYTAFSGQYQTSKRGRRGKVTKPKQVVIPVMVTTPDSTDDEDII